jgi:redox-regulated HSP33 family molecular chaperone
MANQYTKDQIAAVAMKLQGMPDFVKEKTEFSKKETILMLLKEIKDLQKRGYSIEQIASALKGEGIDISTPTLRSYIQQQQKKKAPKKVIASPAVTTEPAKKPVKASSTGKFFIKPDSEDI